jgi:hypothetical protein
MSGCRVVTDWQGGTMTAELCQGLEDMTNYQLGKIVAMGAMYMMGVLEVQWSLELHVHGSSQHSWTTC